MRVLGALQDNLGVIVAQIIGNGSEVELLAGAAANPQGGELQRLIRPAVGLLVRRLPLAHCVGCRTPCDYRERSITDHFSLNRSPRFVKTVIHGGINGQRSAL